VEPRHTFVGRRGVGRPIVDGVIRVIEARFGANFYFKLIAGSPVDHVGHWSGFAVKLAQRHSNQKQCNRGNYQKILEAKD